MKNIFYISFLTLLFVACGTKKQVTETEAPKTTTAVSVGTGTKITTSQPVSDMPIASPNEVTKPIVIEQTPPPVVIEPSSNEVSSNETPKPQEKFNHGIFNTLLQNNVTQNGNVNYTGFKKNRTKLRNYITSLGSNLPNDTWSKEEKLAYWMNAYNAMTVDLILRNLPLESIKDIKDPWDQRLWKLGDKWYNLNEIEHKILRKMGDPRIHFGINCASFSCPPLLNKAFTANQVDKQLDTLARKFVNDTKRNTITPERVEISKIFNWFAKDFKTNGTLIDFLNTYANTTINKNAKVRYKDYDWALNK